MYPCCEVNNVDYAAFLRQRITELRMKINVSEYQMSLELGQNKNYIQGISSGKALPSMAQFFNICDYFNVTPMEFFDTESIPVSKSASNTHSYLLMPFRQAFRKRVISASSKKRISRCWR